MSSDQAVLRRFAELLRVDEVRTYQVARGAHGFALKVGDLWEKVEVPDSGFDARGIDHIVRVLFEAAAALKYRVECVTRARMLQGVVDALESPDRSNQPSYEDQRYDQVKFKPIVTSEVDMKWTDYMMKTVVSSFAVPADLLSPPGPAESTPPRTMNRFEAISLELEDE